MSTAFEDRFGDAAARYAEFRPSYPDSFLGSVATLARERGVAWDVGTGSGQAAAGIARYFGRVIASDASVRQVAHARRTPRVSYVVARAERSPLPARSIDLVTVAQALHWFELGAFWREVRRVLRPGGALVAWAYGAPVLDESPAADVLSRFVLETIADYWPFDRDVVETGYRNIEFPFAEVPIADVAIEQSWTLDQLTGYIGTWSPVRARDRALRTNTAGDLAVDLRAVWGDPASRRAVRWPLKGRAGYLRAVSTEGS